MQPGSAFVFVLKECISPAVKDGGTAFFLHKQLPHDKWMSSVPSGPNILSVSLLYSGLSFNYQLLYETTSLSVGLSSLFFHCVCVAGLRTSRGYLGERIGAWEGQRGLSFLQNMELRAGELLVPRAGLYYIYAQTYFRLSSAGETEGEANGDTVEEEGAQLVQYIYKKVWLCSAFPAMFVQCPVLFEKVFTLFSHR